MAKLEILPELTAGYFGQPSILEHLSVLLRSAREADKPLPLLIFTGPRGQGQKVLAGLVGRYLGKPLQQVTVLRSDRDPCFRVTVAQGTRRYEQFSQAARALEIGSLILLETHGPISEATWDEIAGELEAIRPEEARLGNVIVRAPNLECLPSDARFWSEAHFHFGSNTDEGETRYLEYICERDGIRAETDAIAAVVSVVGGYDWLAEKLLKLAVKYSSHIGDSCVSAEHVSEAWKRWGAHLIGTVSSTESRERDASA